MITANVIGSRGFSLRRQLSSFMGDQRKFGRGDQVAIVGGQIEENLGDVSRIERRTSSSWNGGREHLSSQLENIRNA